MRLVLFDDFRPGVLVDGGVVDCSQAIPEASGVTAMTTVIERWNDVKTEFERLATAGPVIAIDQSRLRGPVAKPGKIMCMAANYREGTGAAALPISGFVVSPDAILEPGGTTVLPPQEFAICHHEAELVLIVGKGGHNIAEADAMTHIFGYTAGVDVSARPSDACQWGYLGKAADGFKPIGPCIVTPDEMGDPHTVQVQLSVDGALRQDYNTSDIGHKIPECIAWFSSIMTLFPGDLLFVGTNHQQLGPLQDGETAEMSIERIGSFTFDISDPKKRSWPKGIDLSIGNNVRGMIQAQAAEA